MRVWMERNFSFSPSKRRRTLSSALKALTMRRPPMVSSILLSSTPHWFWPSSETRFRRLPTLPMTQPAMGSSTSTNSVSCQLMTIIITRQAMIMMGFLNSMSSEVMMEFSTSVTSPLMRAITSPLRSLEKKPMGNEIILL